MSINPYDQYAYNNLGLDEAAQEHYGRAIADYKQQLSVNPLDRFANSNLGAAYVSKRDWSDAAATYAVAVRVHPGNPLLYAEWGSALLRSGKTDEGRRALDQAVQISKQPLILNNVAYAMAQSGVDLEKAEGYARSAVDQTIPENVASLEVPKDYDATLYSLSSFLDTLGWTLYKEGKLAEAGPCLRAAFRIQHDPIVARHLAMLAMRQNHPSEALRYYSYAAAKFGGMPPYIPKELQDYLRSQRDLPKTTAGWVAAAQEKMQELDRLTLPQGHSFSWPRGAGTAPAWVALNVLVDEQGHVTDAKVFKGSEPYSSAALRDVRQLQFPRVAWTHHSLATVRTATFLYDPESHNPAEKVMVFGDLGSLSKPTDQSLESDFDLGNSNIVVGRFMLEGHVRAGLELLRQEVKESKNVPQVYRFLVLLARGLKRKGELKAATAVLNEAVPLQPKDDFGERELAKTLEASGDRAGAIKAYQQLIGMDPDDAEAHYSLATEYEAKAAAEGEQLGDLSTGKAEHNAGSKSQKNQTRQSESQLALTQYSLAAKFNPKNAKYRQAYQTLYEKINHTPPPAAAHDPGASSSP
ncbi:MAG: tetratricopeptide repeat protein [Acidobacteriota bacterium]